MMESREEMWALVPIKMPEIPISRTLMFSLSMNSSSSPEERRKSTESTMSAFSLRVSRKDKNFMNSDSILEKKEDCN